MCRHMCRCICTYLYDYVIYVTMCGYMRRYMRIQRYPNILHMFVCAVASVVCAVALVVCADTQLQLYVLQGYTASVVCFTGWPRSIGGLILQDSFRKSDINCSSDCGKIPVRKNTCKDSARWLRLLGCLILQDLSVSQKLYIGLIRGTIPVDKAMCRDALSDSSRKSLLLGLICGEIHVEIYM